MKHSKYVGCILAGLGAGAVNGLFGAGGGMVLVPLLSLLTPLRGKEIFAASLAVILPLSLVSLGITGLAQDIPWAQATPYLLGSAAGGLIAGAWGEKIPTAWLHRGLGLLILWGGIRYLC